MVKLIEKPKHYFIRWVDAESWSGWHNYEEVEERVKSETFWIDMTGWILYEDKKFIILATKFTSGGLWGNIYKIPKAWVIKKKVIKI